jgi:hypothetical protein
MLFATDGARIFTDKKIDRGFIYVQLCPICGKIFLSFFVASLPRGKKDLE